MKQYWVYILECADQSFYTGVCNDLERRYAEHQIGESPTCYTYKRRPLKLVYQEEFSEIEEAIEREKQIKGWSRAKKKALIEENWDELVRLAKSHPSTSSG